MALRTEHGKDNLSNTLLETAKRFVDRVEPDLYLKLYRITSNARQQITNPSEEEKLFQALLREFQLSLTNRDHATAVLLTVLPEVVRWEKVHERPAEVLRGEGTGI